MAEIAYRFDFYLNPMWFAVILSISGNILVIKKNRWGFMVWVLSNIMWIVEGLSRNATPQVFLFTLYTLISLVGFLSWKRQTR